MSTPARSRSPRQDFQQESPESKEASLTPVVDPDFECDAPQFYDFVAAGLTSSPLTGPAVDGWFGTRSHVRSLSKAHVALRQSKRHAFA